MSQFQALFSFLEDGFSVRLSAQPSIFMFCLQFKQASVLFARALICFSVIKESLAGYNTLFSKMKLLLERETWECVHRYSCSVIWENTSKQNVRKIKIVLWHNFNKCYGLSFKPAGLIFLLCCEYGIASGQSNIKAMFILYRTAFRGTTKSYPI